MTASSLRVVNFSTIVFFLVLVSFSFMGWKKLFSGHCARFSDFSWLLLFGNFCFLSSTLQFIPKKKTVNERQPTHSPLSLSLCSPDLKDLQQGEFDSRTFRVASHVI